MLQPRRNVTLPALEEVEAQVQKIESPGEAKRRGDYILAQFKLAKRYLEEETVYDGKVFETKEGFWIPIETANAAALAAVLYYRRAGELLAQEPKAVGTRGAARGRDPSGGHIVLPPEDGPPTLASRGISKMDSHRFQHLALVPVEEIRRLVDGKNKRHQQVTISEIYQRGRKLKRDDIRSKAESHGRQLPRQGDRFTLYHGDCLEVCERMDEGSVDVIVTDPPYEKESIATYRKLSQLASRVLKEGGSVFAMAGQSYLFQVMRALGEKLTYHWTIAYVMHGGHATRMWQKDVNSYWKPILWFTKGDHDAPWITDIIEPPTNEGGERMLTDRVLHDWGQNESGMRILVDRVSKEGDLILDPFMGAGTTGIVALDLGRRFIGIDCDESCVNIAATRFADSQ